MDLALTKLSSKGQVVIPAEMRKGMHVGEKLVIMRSGNKILLEKASELSEKLMEDLKFAERTEEAWKRHDRGEFKTRTKEEFLKELKKW